MSHQLSTAFFLIGKAFGRKKAEQLLDKPVAGKKAGQLLEKHVAGKKVGPALGNACGMRKKSRAGSWKSLW